MLGQSGLHTCSVRFLRTHRKEHEAEKEIPGHKGKGGCAADQLISSLPTRLSEEAPV